MTILSLQAENFKRLKAVWIEPTGRVVELSGRNGAGKSSCLDAIWAALGGKKASPKEPIRQGEETAQVKLKVATDLGELTVTRTFRRKGEEYTTELRVERADGTRPTKPQDLLDSLIGTLSMDPLHFARAQPQKQVEMVRSFVTDFDFEQDDIGYRAEFEERTAIGRRVDELRAAAEAIPADMGLQGDIIDTNALMDRIGEVAEENERIGQRQIRRDRAREEADRTAEEAARLSRRADDLRAEADKLDLAASQMNDKADALYAKLEDAEALPPMVDVGALRAELAAAQEKNQKLMARNQRLQLWTQAQAKEKEYAEMTARIEARREARRKAVAAAKLPVEGLAFGEDGITLHGVPFEQASQAERLRCSIAVAMAAHPKLRVMRVQDGALLDDEGMKIIGEMAAAADWQVWIEVVSSDRPGTVVIEDGSVANSNAN